MVQGVSKVRPICGILASEPKLLSITRADLSAYFGQEKTHSEPIPFTHTTYYAAEMGSEIWRQYVIFSELRDPAELSDWKHATAAMEKRLADPAQSRRRVNLDPGYLAPGKLVLASTKDFAHRIYLKDGIFGEVTLRYREGRFMPWEWSYPDYVQARDFFEEAYHAYLTDLRGQTVPD
jgi:hypothetical protein